VINRIRGGSTVNVSERTVEALVVEVVLLVVELDPLVTVVDLRNVDEAVDKPLVVVTVEYVLETDPVVVVTGLTSKRPILSASHSLK